VLTGPREYEWIPTQPATLFWAEALDGGDSRAKVPYHDRLLMLPSPFKDQPKELAKMEQRYVFRGGGFAARRIVWGEKGIGLVDDYDRSRRWTRTFLIDASRPGEAPKMLWE